MYSLVFSSFDQWFSVAVTCHSLGKFTFGREAAVFRWYISWKGKRLPDKDPHTTSVIWRSFIAAIFTHCWPFKSIVHDDPGTILTPIWSQFRTKSFGISSLCTTAVTSVRNCVLIASKSWTNIFLLVLPLLLTNWDLAYR